MMGTRSVIVLTLVAFSTAALFPPMMKQDTPEPPIGEPSTASPATTEMITTEHITTDSAISNPSTTEDPTDICSLRANIAVCKECNKISVCLNGRSLPGKDCPPETPYCVNANTGSYCSAQPDPEKAQCRDKFQCTSQGYFPGE